MSDVTVLPENPAGQPEERSSKLPEKLSIAYSPCPNDTFVFHALTHGLVPGAPAFDVTYADIDVTNFWVQKPDAPDIMKISYPAVPAARKRYELLTCGGALGRGCGPLLLTRGAPAPGDLTGKLIAVPSLLSTAYRLFELWAQQNVPGGVRIKVLPFHEIMPAVAAGELDAGLVIHEARFTFQKYGLTSRVDLGEWWEGQTGLPIPLGAIVARRDLGPEALAELSALIQASVDHAWADPEASREYVMEHAQEMDAEVAKQHIALYVNEFTRDLGPEGLAAVDALLAS